MVVMNQCAAGSLSRVVVFVGWEEVAELVEVVERTVFDEDVPAPPPPPPPSSRTLGNWGPGKMVV